MRFAVLVSGHGSTLQALLDAEADGTLAPAEIVVVVCNRPKARAIARARDAGKRTLVIDHEAFDSRDAFDGALLQALRARDVEAVVLAGFMRVLGRGVVDAYARRMLNVHPSLLPAFPGMHAPAQALACGVKVTGCTVHFVESGVDSGPIIGQATVPVYPDDTARALHERIQRRERALLPRVIALLARGAIACEGRRVRVAAVSPDETRDDLNADQFL